MTGHAFDVVPTGNDAFHLLGAKVNGAPAQTILEGSSLELVIPGSLSPGAAVDLSDRLPLDGPDIICSHFSQATLEKLGL